MSRPVMGKGWFYPHEYALLLPAMGEQELGELGENIKANGLLFPIVLYEGCILDGVQRYTACERHKIKLDVSRDFVSWESLPERVRAVGPLTYVTSVNVPRRHLTIQQRAEHALKLLPIYEREAKERQLAGTPLASGEAKGKATEKAAAAVGVSTSTVERARRKQRKAESSNDEEPEEPEPKPERSEQVRETVSTLRRVKTQIVALKGVATPDDVDELEKAVNGLHIAVNKLCAPDKSEPLSDDSVMPWGKYKGKRLGTIHTSYLRWWLRQNPDRDEIESAAVTARYPEKAVLNQKLKFHAYATERVNYRSDELRERLRG